MRFVQVLPTARRSDQADELAFPISKVARSSACTRSPLAWTKVFETARIDSFEDTEEVSGTTWSAGFDVIDSSSGHPDGRKTLIVEDPVQRVKPVSPAPILVLLEHAGLVGVVRHLVGRGGIGSHANAKLAPRLLDDRRIHRRAPAQTRRRAVIVCARSGESA